MFGRPCMLAMHTQTTFNQGLLQVPHSLLLPSLLTLKDETANECSLLQQEKIN